MKRLALSLLAALLLALIPNAGLANISVYKWILNCSTNYLGNDYPGGVDYLAKQEVIQNDARWGIPLIGGTTNISGTSPYQLEENQYWLIDFLRMTNFYVPNQTSHYVTASSTNIFWYVPYVHTLSVTSSVAPISWTLTGPAEFTNATSYRTSGSNSVNIVAVPTGTYSIAALPTMRGYITPTTTSTNITEASPLINTLALDYVPYSNSLSVTVIGYPAGNAVWSITGPTDWTNATGYATGFTNNATISGVPTGTYAFNWPGVIGYTTPTNTLTINGASPTVNCVTGIYVLAYPTNIPVGTGIQKFYQRSYFFTNVYLHDSGVPLHTRILNNIGPTGTAASISVAWSSNGPPGSSVVVTNVGSSNNAFLGFIIPVGATGATGTAATIGIAWVSNGAPGSAASVTNTGNSNSALFGFVIPASAETAFLSWIDTNTYVKSNSGNWAGTWQGFGASAFATAAQGTEADNAAPSTSVYTKIESDGRFDPTGSAYAVQADLNNHKTNTDVHPISGVTGLQGALDGKVATNDPDHLSVPLTMTNLVNQYGPTGTASFVSRTLTITHGTNTGGGTGNITNLLSTDGSVVITAPGGPQPNLSVTNYVKTQGFLTTGDNLGNHIATQQVTWIELIGVQTNLVLSCTNANPAVTNNVYTPRATVSGYPAWSNVNGFIVCYDTVYYHISSNTFGGDLWTKDGAPAANPIGAYNPIAGLATGSPMTAAYAYVTNTATWLAGWNGTNWNITRDGVEQFSTTNYATLAQYLSLTNGAALGATALQPTGVGTGLTGITAAQVGAVSNSAAGILAAGGATGTPLYVQSYGTSSSTAYRGDWGANNSNRTAALEVHTNTWDTAATDMAVIKTNYYGLQDGIAASNLAYSASTNAEAARVIGTNAQTVANAALPKAGGTMAGNINLGGTTVSNGSFVGDGTGLTGVTAAANNNAANLTNFPASVVLTNTTTYTQAVAQAAAALPASSTNALAVTALQVTGGNSTTGAIFGATNTLGQGTWIKQYCIASWATQTVVIPHQTTVIVPMGAFDSTISRNMSLQNGTIVLPAIGIWRADYLITVDALSEGVIFYLTLNAVPVGSSGFHGPANTYGPAQGSSSAIFFNSNITNKCALYGAGAYSSPTNRTGGLNYSTFLNLQYIGP